MFVSETAKLGTANKTFRCARGHEWFEKAPARIGDQSHTFSLEASPTERFCCQCLVEMMRDNCGGIEEVTEEPEEERRK